MLPQCAPTLAILWLQSFSSFPLDSTPHQFDNTYCKEMTTANRTANSRFSVPGAGQQGSAGPTPLQSDSDTVAAPITRFVSILLTHCILRSGAMSITCRPQLA